PRGGRRVRLRRIGVVHPRVHARRHQLIRPRVRLGLGTAPRPSRTHPERNTPMTTNLSPDAPVDEQRWGQPAPHDRVIVTLEALGDAGFVAELVPSVEAGRRRALELLPDGCSVFTSASETLRLSGLDEAINQSGRYDAIRPRVWGMDRATEMAEIRRLSATPDVVIGSVSAV